MRIWKVMYWTAWVAIALGVFVRSSYFDPGWAFEPFAYLMTVVIGWCIVDYYLATKHYCVAAALAILVVVFAAFLVRIFFVLATLVLVGLCMGYEVCLGIDRSVQELGRK